MSEPQEKTISVGALARVEGEGALKVKIRDGRVAEVELAIYEPPRFFEALLRGRPLEDAPDITARICGICPIAYQMTSVHALEAALGVTVSPEIRALRRLLYCAEWIESHGVHMHLLHVPDFFQCDSSLELAKRFPAEVTRGLQLKKLGNRLLEILGGRATNPINVAVGGFYRAPSREQLRALLPELRAARDAAVEVVRWVRQFSYPEFQREYEMVALRHPREYPMNEGRIVSSGGLDIAVPEFHQHFAERQVAHSTALHCVLLPDHRSYLVGPLARLNLNRDQLWPLAQQLSDDVGIAWPCHNPHQSLIARGLEVVQSFDEAILLVEQYEGCQPARVDYQPRAARGCWATEAPRGMIYHEYEIADDGTLVSAKIIPPTSQNQWQIERDLTDFLPRLLQRSDAAIAADCERLIRAYDPCISCATHFLKLDLQRDAP
jgi:coenzyme F420-reducing hydrogenase alpha subunit